MGPNVQRCTNCNSASPVEVQLLSILGSWLQGHSKPKLGTDQAYPSHRLVGLCQLFIRESFVCFLSTFPYTVKDPLTLTCETILCDFVHTKGFPNIIGVIDFSQHCHMGTPWKWVYVNMRNYHSFNAQLICSAIARWPESTQDSFIVHNCSAGNRLKAGGSCLFKSSFVLSMCCF